MNCSSEEIYRASLLVGFALSPKNRPSAIAEYAALIREYRTIAGVREAASKIAAGLKLELIDDGAEIHGLIVRVNPGSLFTPTLQDFRGTRSVEERIGGIRTPNLRNLTRHSSSRRHHTGTFGTRI